MVVERTRGAAMSAGCSEPHNKRWLQWKLRFDPKGAPWNTDDIRSVGVTQALIGANRSF
jgi:hypothetical protein